MKSEIRLIDRATVWGSQDDTAVSDGGNFSVDKAWMVYDSPVGKFEIGRRPAGAWQGAFVNYSTKADRIMWNFPAMNNFKSYVFTEKQVEQDGYWGDLEDTDKDYYEAAGGYEAEGVKAWLGLGWKQDNIQDDAAFGLAQYDQNRYRVKGYGEFTINETFSLAGEFDYNWGDRDYDCLALLRDRDPEWPRSYRVRYRQIRRPHRQPALCLHEW